MNERIRSKIATSWNDASGDSFETGIPGVVADDGLTIDDARADRQSFDRGCGEREAVREVMAVPTKQAHAAPASVRQTRACTRPPKSRTDMWRLAMPPHRQSRNIRRRRIAIAWRAIDPRGYLAQLDFGAITAKMVNRIANE